ncbi:hypothetical protein [Budvicia aquatica]|uniref:hypothetical protein n=1 Tax=Budvicia aquatica TaxID=82979 RepID=UPI00106D2253|nr:hypothetical protein [Budvicia aquatica]
MPNLIWQAPIFWGRGLKRLSAGLCLYATVAAQRNDRVGDKARTMMNRVSPTLRKSGRMAPSKRLADEYIQRYQSDRQLFTE